MTHEYAISLIQETLTSLVRSGIIQDDINIEESTSLLGKNSVLDSIAFVTFITELEDRVSRVKGQEFFLVLNEIHDFNPNDAMLSVDTLAKYLAGFSEK